MSDIIHLLPDSVANQIAAGEVIQRPASVIKELVENAIDAQANAITVEVKDGGKELIRITDNGTGIAKEDIVLAFTPHATSKIKGVEDLLGVSSLGFRGEALASVAAVSQLEMVTKTKEALMGNRYVIQGGEEKTLEAVGCPEGTTFLIHNLFYNTPARLKFLKSSPTETSYISTVLERLALSHPEVAFRFIAQNQTKLSTPGNGKLKDVIYHIYGRDIASNLLEVHREEVFCEVEGFLGKPVISRGNRNFENYYVNGRYAKNNIISRAIEDAYKDFTMQHKYPFVVLHIEIDGEHVDVNVHPTKMELRFNNQQEVYNAIYSAVDQGLHEKELIPHVEMPEPKPVVSNTPSYAPKPKTGSVSQTPAAVQTGATSGMTGGVTSASMPQRKKAIVPPPQERDLEYFMSRMKERVLAEHEEKKRKEKIATKQAVHTTENIAENISVKESPSFSSASTPSNVAEEKTPYMQNASSKSKITMSTNTDETTKPEPSLTETPKQMELFEDHLLTREAMQKYKVVGQVFETYWLVEYDNSLYIIDQHAAHERVLYEKTLKSMKTREFTSQMISPPIVLNLSMQEAELLNTYMDQFTRIGFEIEEFGQDSYAVRAVPDNLFSIAKKELLIQMLDSLSDEITRNQSPDLIDEKIASMSCKAAVKGNMKLSVQEVDALIGELLSLDNPYHCPHGRPTIIAMTKRELEKKFKRIV